MLGLGLIQSSRTLCKLAQILQSSALSDDEDSQELGTLVVTSNHVSNKEAHSYYAMSPLSTMKNEHTLALQKGLMYSFRDELLLDLQKLPAFFRDCLLSSGDMGHPITDYLRAFSLVDNSAVQQFMTKVYYLGKGVLRLFDVADSPPLTFGNSTASILRELIKTKCCILSLIVQVRTLVGCSFQIYSALTYLLPAAIVSLEEFGCNSVNTLSSVLDVLLWASEDGKAVFYMTFRMAIFLTKQRSQSLYNRILQLIATKLDLPVENPLACMDTLLASDSQSPICQTKFLILLHTLYSSDLWDALKQSDKLKLELSIQAYYTMLVKEACDALVATTNPNYMYEVHLLIQSLGLKYSTEDPKN